MHTFTLYHYEHCPYCVRVRLAAGLLGIPLNLQVIANDDESTPIGLVGKKVVPILIREDGTPMPESLDIIHYLDKNQRFTGTIKTEIEAWVNEASKIAAFLINPRNVRAAFGEFATNGARQYYEQKKSQTIGDFSEALEKSDKYFAAIYKQLNQLEILLTESFAGGEDWGINDIILFPLLRNLTIVKGIEFPPRVAAYLLHIAGLSKINLLHTIAN